MSFIDSEFFLFIICAALLYYIMPKRIQWIWLLVLSYAYYLTFGKKIVFFIVFTTITTFLGALIIAKINREGINIIAANKETITLARKKEIKARIKHNKRLILVLDLVVNFGMLGVLKYFDFFISNINYIINTFEKGNAISTMELMLPLGISFYTFQSMGYIIDIYQGKYEPEKNVFKFALFVSFFPQIMQGPIGRFDRLAHQFYEEHCFDLQNIEFAIQLILWGLFKKTIFADRTAVYVNMVFAEHERFCGFYIIVALLLYSVELYADFSGGIDIVIGTAQIFGIKLDNNFARPFFSHSISEFWRRWHITLGTWMKDYIFYPFSLSKAMNKFGKFSKNKFGNTIGRVLPICVANLLIFFIVGVWHGAAWKFVAYGMYNGIIIAFSNLMEPVYNICKKKLKINSTSSPWRLFQILRTFILINIGWYFDMAKSFNDAIVMMKDTIYQINFSQLTDGTIFGMGMTQRDFKIVIIGCFVWFIVSLLQERHIKIRQTISEMPLIVRWGFYLALIFIPPIYGYIGITQEFIYAQF